MASQQGRELDSVVVNDQNLEMLYEFNEIVESIHSSIATRKPLCFFLHNDDVAICISPVKKIIENHSSADKREMEIMLDYENTIVRLHDILAVGEYETH